MEGGGEGTNGRNVSRSGQSVSAIVSIEVGQSIEQRGSGALFISKSLHRGDTLAYSSRSREWQSYAEQSKKGQDSNLGDPTEQYPLKSEAELLFATHFRPKQ